MEKAWTPAMLPRQDRPGQHQVADAEHERVGERNDAHACGVNSGERSAEKDHDEPVRDVALHLNGHAAQEQPFPHLPAAMKGWPHLVDTNPEIAARTIEPAGKD